VSIIAAFILCVHYALVSILCLYGAHRIYHSLVAKRVIEDVKSEQRRIEADPDFRPIVTLQIPLYNEKFVAARIIDQVTKFDYPIDKLQIQVIDDSSDECVQIVAERVAHYKSLGFDIDHLRRSNRQGYKAGALADAMDDVKGEFIAIFDADFIPETDFLIKTLPHFKDAKTGLVQSRWSYLNTKTNMLTRLQSIMLDAHFGVEQVTRYGKDVYFNFNGTAGIWRKAAIMDAGGWKADTLTEDTDLSYRAQLTTIWKSNVPFRKKAEASLHLTANITYLLMFVDSLFFLLPTVHIRQQMEPNLLAWLDIPIFAFASLSHAYFFLSGQKRLYGKVLDKLFVLPALLATSIGLGVNNGRAVIEALIGYKTGFARTPKIGSAGVQKALNNSYKTHSENWATAFELCLGLLYAGFLAWALYKTYWIVTPFLALFAIGFFYTSILSLKENRIQAKGRAAAKPTTPLLTETSNIPKTDDVLLIAE